MRSSRLVVLGALSALLVLPVGVAAQSPMSPAAAFAATINVRSYTKTLTVPVSVKVVNLPAGKAVKGYFLSEDPDANPSVSAAGWRLQPTKFTLSDAEGPHTIYAWAKYTGGVRSLVAASDTINVDRVAPVVTDFDVTEDVASSRTVNVTFDSADDQSLEYNSGIFKYAVVNGATVPDFSSPVWKDAAPATVRLPKGNGVKTVSVFVRDRANNVSAVQSDTVELDLGEPVVTLTVPAGSRSRTVTVKVTATDPSGSGIAGYFLREGDDTTPALNAAGWKVKPTSFTVSAGQGVKTIYAWAKDANGSISAYDVDSTVLDLTAPTADLDLVSANPSTTRTITVDATGSTDNLAIAKYALVKGTALPTLSSDWKTDPPTSFLLPLGNGSKTVTLFVKDWAGNVSAGDSITVNMQLPAPTVTLNVLPTHTTSLTVAIDLNFTDPAGTGIVGYMLKMTNSTPAAGDAGWKPLPTSYAMAAQPDGLKTIYAWVKDKNGTVSSVSSDTVRLDRTGPEFELTLHGSPIDLDNDISGLVEPSGIKDYGVVVTAGGTIPTSSAVTVWLDPADTHPYTAASGERVTVFIRDILNNVSVAADGVTSQVVP